jgi:hypothetical protein
MKRLNCSAVAAACVLGLTSVSIGQVHRMSDEVNLAGLRDSGQVSVLMPRQIAAQRFKASNPGASLFRTEDRVRRVYGQAFSRAATPKQSAEGFLQEHAAMFGVSRDQLLDAGPFADGQHVQPIMYQPETDSYKFTGVYYTQVQDGIPVFRSRLTLLVRNEADHPLVLASADLRDLGGFRVAAPSLAHVDLDAGRGRIVQNLGIARIMRQELHFHEPSLTIWAGVDNTPADPALAYEQIVEIGDISDPDRYQKWLYLVDAFSGQVLHRESKLLHADLEGNISCLCTQGVAAATCEEQILTPMPYARVVAGGQVTFADADGNFSFNGIGPGSVSVSSAIRGEFFRVFSSTGNPVLNLSQQASVPGSVDFLHNSANNEQYTRAAVDAYYHSNVVRDFALKYNPAYPTISTQTEFTINVNLNDNCNAFYNGNSVNYFTSGGGCANTAFASVVYHEYGHHLVNTAGSGQGQYGEGMSDTVGMLITEDPILGVGFQNNCNAGIRSAINTIQYPCSGGIHFCGQLISGCVWDTLNELKITHPATYLDIISNLTINSILLHTGTSIDPTITIDFLTLDDDDDDIFNGTPHYNQINAGFSAHNMDPPQLDQLRFIYPDGLPELLVPNQSTIFTVEVEPLAGMPQNDSASLFYRVGNTGSFTEIALNEVSANVYEVEVPAVDCGTPVEYYISAQTTMGMTQTNPREAPNSVYAAFAASDLVVTFADQFDTDLGWIVGAPDDDATTGFWERADPVGTSTGQGQAQPSSPYIGSACYITGQHPGGGAGANDVDHGKTTLFSPVLDLSEALDATISYQRWYSNHAGANPFNDIFEVDISNDGGQSWVNVETVGPSGPQVMGGWYFNQFLVSDFVAPSSQVQVRFIASDYDPQALVEAAVDDFRVTVIECKEINPCPGDLDGDGVVNVSDLLILLGAWGPCDNCPQDLNGDGIVNVSDLLALLADWGACP